MGILTDPGNGNWKLLQPIRKWSNAAAFCCYVLGLVYFCAILHPQFNAKTYFSENGLLPGLVDEEFRKTKILGDMWKELQKAAPRQGSKWEIPSEWLRDQFTFLGLDSWIQNFSVSLPETISPPVAGRNVFGILRAPRASSTESIVLVVPWSPAFNLIALVLNLAAFCREQIYWSKDIIFLFADQGQLGVQAWLAAYHGRELEGVRAEALAAHAGSIQAAVAVELSPNSQGPFTHADIRFNMINGQLPNLDLANLLVRMAEKEALQPTIFHQASPSWSIYESVPFWSMAKMALEGLAWQASCRGNGLHGPFGSYGIEALTFSPYQKTERRSSEDYHVGLEEIGRIMEGTLRSLNNLLERFHQSFFFYIRPSPHRYISIASYMPTIGLILLAPLIKICCLWAEMNDTIVGDKKKDSSEESSAAEKGGAETVLSAAPCLLLAELLGVVLVFLPHVAVPQSQCLLTSWLGCSSGALAFPYFLSRRREGRVDWSPSGRLLRTLMLLWLSLSLGVVSVVNFGLGLLLAVVWTPVALLSSPSAFSLFRCLKAGLLLAVHPLVLIILLEAVGSGSFSQQPFSELLGLAKELTNSALVSSVFNYYVHNNWLYGLMCLCFVPQWTLMWALVWKSCD